MPKSQTAGEVLDPRDETYRQARSRARPRAPAAQGLVRTLSSRSPAWLVQDRFWYVAGVVVGSMLFVVTAIRQPFSFDELTQMAPYGSDDVSTITDATRQPPLDPLLGALVQHVLGVGQLRQRLVPVLAGMGILVLMCLLFRRMRLGAAGAFGIWVLATAPLMVRYSAYTRPYALPMFFMVLFVVSADRWLTRRSLLWLGVAAAAAVAMPLARVPEPCSFLLVAGVTLVVFSIRGALPWSRTLPLVVTALGALLFVGIPTYRTLESETVSFYDPSVSGVMDRFGDGLHEIWHFFLPLLAACFPWWPLTALAVLACLVVGESRRRLLGWAMWWPLVAAPVVFAVAYHFLNTIPFDRLPYRDRAAFFFVPSFVLVIVALASVAADRRILPPALRVGVCVLLAGVLVGQIPRTAQVVLANAAPDFDEISTVLTSEVPADAIVLYDRPTPVGQGRQPFLGTPRYMGATPYVVNVRDVRKDPAAIPDHGPVYVLINGQCASPGRCLPTTSAWDEAVPGFKILRQKERFTLYAPVDGQDGHVGVIGALTAFGATLGPEIGYVETVGAARMLQLEGELQRANELIRRMLATASPDVEERMRPYLGRALSLE